MLVAAAGLVRVAAERIAAADRQRHCLPGGEGQERQGDERARHDKGVTGEPSRLFMASGGTQTAGQAVQVDRAAVRRDHEVHGHRALIPASPSLEEPAAGPSGEFPD